MTTSPQPSNQPQTQATVIQIPSQPAISNDTFISRFSSTVATIKFSGFWDLTNSDNWNHYKQTKGIYVIYMIPNHMKDKLNTLPVINEYAIYVGQSNSNLHKRFRAFKGTLDAMVEHSLAGTVGSTATISADVRQSAAIQFYKDIIKTHKISYHAISKEFVGIPDHTLMVQVAEHKPAWIRKTSNHENVLISEMDEAYPNKLYNQV